MKIRHLETLLAMAILTACSPEINRKEVAMEETGPGNYSAIFFYEVIEADKFWGHMSLQKSGLDDDFLNDDVSLRLAHVDGQSLDYKNIQGSGVLKSGEEVEIYRGKLRMIDNDSASYLISFVSDGDVKFRLILKSSLSGRVVIVRKGYGSGG